MSFKWIELREVKIGLEECEKENILNELNNSDFLEDIHESVFREIFGNGQRQSVAVDIFVDKLKIIVKRLQVDGTLRHAKLDGTEIDLNHIAYAILGLCETYEISSPMMIN